MRRSVFLTILLTGCATNYPSAGLREASHSFSAPKAAEAPVCELARANLMQKNNELESFADKMRHALALEVKKREAVEAKLAYSERESMQVMVKKSMAVPMLTCPSPPLPPPPPPCAAPSCPPQTVNYICTSPPCPGPPIPVQEPWWKDPVKVVLAAISGGAGMVISSVASKLTARIKGKKEEEDTDV
jgi:hypothetical protein